MYIHHAIYHSLYRGKFEYEREKGAADHLLLFFRTPVMLSVDGEIYTISKPSIVVFSSYKKHKYVSLSDEYCDDFIHFEADEEEDFLKELHLPLD